MLILLLLIIITSPYLYSCITWNYGLLLMTLLLMYTNFVIYLVLLIIYLILPSEIIEDILKRIIYCVRTIFYGIIEKTEQNIHETFKIHKLYEIPERSILIWHPHGISGVTPVIHNGYRITDPDFKPTKGVVHYFFFMIPLLKDIIKILNAIPSDYTSIKETVKKESISITIGGINEMAKTTNKQLELIIKKRKGIFKIALETGTPIVPILTYGENEVFTETDNEFLIWLNEELYNLLKFRLPIPSLQSIRNWANLLFRPLDTVHTYTGKPIYVQKIENPTEKHIKRLRQIYIKRVRELFFKTNPGEFSLKIV